MRHSPIIARCAARGFTLVEVVVTVGIIVFLAGLTVTAMVNLAERAEIGRTKNILRLLDVAMAEWELTTDRKLTWGFDPFRTGRYDIACDREPILVITEMLGVIGRSSAVQSILAGLDPDLCYKYDPGDLPNWIGNNREERHLDELVDRFGVPITILDAWGTPIYSTHPGSLSGDTFGGYCETFGTDDDGTQRTQNERDYGVARNRRVCFVSAGPDRRFGLLREVGGLPESEHEAAIERAKGDNVYSYRPIWPRKK